MQNAVLISYSLLYEAALDLKESATGQTQVQLKTTLLEKLTTVEIRTEFIIIKWLPMKTHNLSSLSMGYILDIFTLTICFISQIVKAIIAAQMFPTIFASCLQSVGEFSLHSALNACIIVWLIK